MGKTLPVRHLLGLHLSPVIRTLCIALATAALAAGCGDDADAPERAGTQQEQEQPRKEQASLGDVCAKAARDLEDPVAFEKTLPPSPQPNATKDPELLREASELRGTKEIVQSVFDAAGDHPAYQEMLRSLIQELDDAEVTARQDYEIDEAESELRTRWRAAEREAPAPCRDVRRPA